MGVLDEDDDERPRLKLGRLHRLVIEVVGKDSKIVKGLGVPCSAVRTMKSKPAPKVAEEPAVGAAEGAAPKKVSRKRTKTPDGQHSQPKKSLIDRDCQDDEDPEGEAILNQHGIEAYRAHARKKRQELLNRSFNSYLSDDPEDLRRKIKSRQESIAEARELAAREEARRAEQRQQADISFSDEDDSAPGDRTYDPADDPNWGNDSDDDTVADSSAGGKRGKSPKPGPSGLQNKPRGGKVTKAPEQPCSDASQTMDETLAQAASQTPARTPDPTASQNQAATLPLPPFSAANSVQERENGQYLDKLVGFADKLNEYMDGNIAILGAIKDTIEVTGNYNGTYPTLDLSAITEMSKPSTKSRMTNGPLTIITVLKVWPILCNC